MILAQILNRVNRLAYSIKIPPILERTDGRLSFLGVLASDGLGTPADGATGADLGEGRIVTGARDRVQRIFHGRIWGCGFVDALTAKTRVIHSGL